MELVEGGLDDYLVVYDQLATGGTPTLAEIVADFSKANAEEPEASSDTEVMEVEEEPVPPVIRGEVTADSRSFSDTLMRTRGIQPSSILLTN